MKRWDFFDYRLLIDSIQITFDGMMNQLLIVKFKRQKKFVVIRIVTLLRLSINFDRQNNPTRSNNDFQLFNDILIVQLSF
jgi:hypothetical protein